jgi:hypothetical protein
MDRLACASYDKAATNPEAHMTAVLPIFRFLSLVAVLSSSLWSTAGWAQAQTQPHLDVPYVPTPQVVVENMLKLAGVGAND